MKTYFLAFFIPILFTIRPVQAGNAAFCMLTVNPPAETLEFIEQLAQDAIGYGVDVYIAIDDQNFNFSSINTSSHVRILNVSIEQCVSHGYQFTTHYGGNKSNVAAWDKALLYFSVFNKNYSFVWFTENDVFIPSTQAVRSLHLLYSNDSDLVTPTNSHNVDGNATYWQWSETVGRLVPPWSNSMVNYVGLSQRLLQALNEYVRWRGKSAFHEYFFHTTAIQNNMTIVIPLELSTVEHRQHVSWNDVYNRPNNIWHPVKMPVQRSFYRKRLAEETLRRKSIDYVNDFHKLKEDVDNMTSIAEDLKKILPKFEISKGLLSAHDRLFMRQYFMNLAEEYRKESDSDLAVALAKELADHAYKLPEAPVTLSAPKGSRHLQLARELMENKRRIFQLLQDKSNDFALTNLRLHTIKIIRDLTREIRREALEQQRKENIETVSAVPISSSSYMYSLSYKANAFHAVLCIQIMPFITILILMLMVRRIARFHSK